MGFINSVTLIFLTRLYRFCVSPFKFLRWIPVNSIKQSCIIILERILCPSWIFVKLLSIRSFNLNLVLLTMFDNWFPILSLKKDSKLTKIIFLALVLLSVPLIKVTKNRKGFCTWSPLHILDVSIVSLVKTIHIVWSSNIKKSSLCFLKFVHPVFILSLSFIQIFGIFIQVAIINNDL